MGCFVPCKLPLFISILEFQNFSTVYQDELIRLSFKCVWNENCTSFSMNLLEQEQRLPLVYDSLPVKCHEIVYDVLDEQSVTQAIHCLITTFPDNEPMTKSLGISQDAFQDLAEIFVRKTAIDGLSIAAKDRWTGKLLGCQISEDFEGEPPGGLEHLHSDFNPILALLNTLDSHYKSSHLIFPNELLHEFMMGVYPEHKGRNIGYNLLKASHILGRMKGFKGAIAEVTGPISQRIFVDKHHYQVLKEIKYHQFKFHGNACFKGIGEYAACQLVYKDLSFSHYKKNLIMTHKKKSLRLAA